MLDNRHIEQKGEKQPELSTKEQVLELLSVGICFLLLLGCFLKVIFL